MHAILHPIITHKLQHLEELLEMQVLLVCNDVYALNKVVCFFPVYRCGKVARGVKGSAVRLYDYARRHVVFRKINYFCALVSFEQALSVKLVYNGLHLVLIKALAGIAVKLNAEQLVYFAYFFKRERLHSLPQVYGFAVALLYLPEPGPCFIVETFVLFSLLMEAHIKLNKLAHGRFFYRLAAAPFFVCNYHLAKLGTPVAKVVYSYRIIAKRLIYAVKAVAYSGRWQVAYVEGLSYVYGGKLHAHVLAAAFVAVAVILPLGKHALYRSACGPGPILKKVEIAALNLGLCYR